MEFSNVMKQLTQKILTSDYFEITWHLRSAVFRVEYQIFLYIFDTAYCFCF